MKRAAWCLNSGLVRPSIGQAFADDALDRFCGALCIAYAKFHTFIEAEIEFGNRHKGQSLGNKPDRQASIHLPRV